MASYIAAFLGLILGAFAIYAFDMMPIKWLCDYDETPVKKRFPAGRLRRACFSLFFTALVSASSFFACAGVETTAFAFIIPPLIALLLLIAISDILYQIIPDELVIAFGVLSLAFAALDLAFHEYNIHDFLLSPAAGLFTAVSALLLLRFLGGLIFKKDVMGFGDIKLFAASGILAGFPGVIIVMFITVLISGIIFGVQLLFKMVSPDDEKPLGPYIVISTALFLCFHEEIFQFIRWYLSLFH